MRVGGQYWNLQRLWCGCPILSPRVLHHLLGINALGATLQMDVARDDGARPLAEDDDEGIPTLSAHALEALKEFLAEQNRALGTDDSAAIGSGAPAHEEKVELVSEDWRLSQFWYDQETAETVANELLTLCESLRSPSVACIACPTLYAYLKKFNPNVPLQLLEYDRRFEQYGSEFTFYDYNQPEELPSSLKHAYQIVVADPPYLSKECLEKVTQTISFLKHPGKSFLLLLTGAVQKHRAAELLGLHPCGFQPQHSSKLGNEFHLFTNYDPGMRLGGWKQDPEMSWVPARS